MRQITAAAQAALNQQYATEPIFVLGINWAGSNITYYCDKTLYDSDGSAVVPGKILKINNIESILNITGNKSSTAVDIVLDDSDGELLSIMNNVDIHKRPCYLYQYFDGLSISDMFMLFEGLIVSDVAWNDSDRTLKFSITTLLENYEAGFSPEEGDVVDLREDLVGKAWPMVFGQVYKCPTARITDIPVGTTTSPMGFHDYWLDWQVVRIGQVADFMHGTAIFYIEAAGVAFFSDLPDIGNELQDAGNNLLIEETSLRTKITNLQGLLNQQLPYELKETYILTDFPINLPFNKEQGIFEVGNVYVVGKLTVVKGGLQGLAHFQFTGPYDSIEFAGFNPTRSQVQATDAGPTQIGIISPQTGLITDLQGAVARDVAAFRYIPAGSTLRYLGDYPVKYVVNIIGASVIAVYANRTFEGYTRRMLVPKSYYKQITVIAQSSLQLPGKRFACTGIKLFRPLSTLLNEHWSDDEIFVTCGSSVSGTFQTVITYIVETFTIYGVDTQSLNSVPEFVMNFAVLELKDSVTLISEICWQCKVAVSLKNGLFHFVYLPAKNLSGVHITLNDVIEDSVSLSFTPTEKIITKMIGTWRIDWSDPKKNRIVIRYNVAKYGTIEEEHDFYCFNVQKAVEATMSFWLYRRGNTWKHIKLQVPIKFLVLENYDIIMLNSDVCTMYGINGGSATPAVVEDITYDSDKNILELDLELPIKLGTNIIDNQYWPSGTFQWMGAGEVSQIFNNIKPPKWWNGIDDTPRAMLEPIFIGAVGEQDSSGGIIGVEPYSHESLTLPYEYDFDGERPTPVVGDYGGTLGDYIAPQITMKPNSQELKLSQIPAPKWPLLYQDPAQQQQPQQQQSGGNAFPGKVTGGSGTKYNVNMYRKGLNNAPEAVSATVLQINPQDTIPKDTAVIVLEITTSQKTDTGSSQSVTNYYIQPPVWLNK